jgi:RimJ/RimL family protein N-acetyltransferase
MPEIITPRLRLRPFELEDLEGLAALDSDPEVMRYIGKGQVRSRQDTEMGLQRLMQHQAQHGFGLWAVVRQSDQAFLGWCGLKYLDSTPEIEVGYRLAQNAWGQGFATEAAIASVNYGFAVLELDRIVAIAQPANRASRRVIEKLGMQYEKAARFYETDCVYYAVNRDRWQAKLDSAGSRL